mmetsp:Transcript_8880/g.18410  ORF Transcript_8880/g.18410 Transcript_8880/m.18410 type:complete len:334 (-) Transcript_8880:594-1595(-)
MGLLLTVVYVSLWYVVNIGILLLNKIVINDHFRYPVALTLLHQAFCYLCADFCIKAGVAPLQNLNSRKQLFHVILLSQTFGFSIVTGIWCLQYIPVSFDQAIGSTTPAFTALIALVFIGRSERPLTYLTLVPVVVGIAIASFGEPSFHLIGFLLSVASTGARSLKSVLQQVLLSESGVKLDGLNALRLMCPWAVAALLPLSYIIEGSAPWRTILDTENSAAWLPYLALNTVMAFLVNLLNLLVTKQTSALTIQVFGNAKGVVAAMVSVYVFQNEVTARGCFGYLVCVTGTALYSWAKSHDPPAPAKDKHAPASDKVAAEESAPQAALLMKEQV